MSDYVWQNIEIIGGGFVTGLVAHPREKDLLYARTDVGGAYRFDGARERWQPITDFIGQKQWRLTGVESVALDPSDPERVYLALGIYSDARLGPAVIARSDDRGATFSFLEVPFTMGGNEAGRGSGERLAVDPNCGDRLFFGSRADGLFRSDDGGRSFVPVSTFPRVATALENPTPGRFNYLTQSVGIVFVLFDAGSGKPGQPTPRLYAAVSSPSASLYRSVDAGETWQPVPGQPLGLRPIRAALAANGDLYLTYGREPGPNTMFDGAVFRFDAALERFSDITPQKPDPEAGQPFGYAGISLDPHHPERLVVTTAYRDHAPGSGGDELFRSLDAGKTWRAFGQDGTRDSGRAKWLEFRHGKAHVGHWMYALVLDPHDPDRLYYATGQTIWAATNLTAVDRGARAEFRMHATGIEETVPLALASPAAGAAVVVGTGDISGFTVFAPEDARENVHLCEPTFKDTSSIDVAELAPNVIVRVGSRGWNRERDRDTGAISRDGGRTFQAFAAYPAEAAELGVVALAADGRALLWQPRGLGAFVSNDDGQSFEPCRGLGEQRLLLLADRADPRCFYALEREGGGFFTSRDGGQSFRRTASLPRGSLSDACAVAGHTGQLWLALGGELWHTRDAGSTVARCAAAREVTHVTLGCAREPDGYPSLFVVGEIEGDAGFFRSEDRGQTFVRINDESHKFGQIRAICGDPKRFGRLYVATGGRGALYGDPANRPAE